MINVDELGARIIIGFGDGHVFISESVLFGIIIAIIISAVLIWMGSNLQTVPKGKQIFAEFIVDWVYRFTENSVGKGRENFAPLVGTLFAYIGLGSALGLFGLRPITADINVAASLGLLTFITIRISEFRYIGVGGKLKEMCDPYPFMFPLKIIEDCTLPVTLTLRLFGNILGGVVVVELWMHLMETISYLVTDIPFMRAIFVLPLNGFFDMFEPVIQTYIFVTLTTVFLSLGIGEAKERKREHSKISDDFVEVGQITDTQEVEILLMKE